MKIDQSLFDKEEFKQWLESKPDGSTVGTARNGCNCPIASFIRQEKKLPADIHQDKAIITDNTVAMFPSREIAIDLPRWAQDFIWKIDSEAEAKKVANMRNSHEVSKEQALEVLGDS